MTLFRRGTIYWFEFVFRGQRIRKSTKSTDRRAAARIEREERRRLELGGLPEESKPLLFSKAAAEWHRTNSPHWSEANARLEKYNIENLLPMFGRLLLTDIGASDIGKYQTVCRKNGLSNRTANMHIGTLRAVLRQHRLWARIQPDVRMLTVRTDVGRALSEDEQRRILEACRKSRSRSLYPAVLLSLHTGLRNAELRHLRWRSVDLIEGRLIVGKSKTAAGTGRTVPLSRTALAALVEWATLFPERQPADFVFASERYCGEVGDGGLPTGYDTDPRKPILSWKSGWTVARKSAGVSCRWHDLRHSFVSALAEGSASDATIKALSGHLSNRMLERYSHTRNEAKRAAISILDSREYPQNPPQSEKPNASRIQ